MKQRLLSIPQVTELANRLWNLTRQYLFQWGEFAEVAGWFMQAILAKWSKEAIGGAVQAIVVQRDLPIGSKHC